MPKLRFKGFMDDWEQRKLGDVCCFINGDRSSNYPSTADFIDSGIPFVGSDALGETLVNKTKLRYISREKYQQMNGLKIEIDDVLYTLRGAGFGKCSIADFSNGTVASSCVGIRCTEELDAKFLVQWLSSPSADNEKNMAVNGSTAQNISVEDMKNYVICAPGLDEQKKVSAQLYTLDKLITLHQRKCDELQKVKKYMLQKMFPKKGEKVPEIRLAGFTGDWEQRKFHEVFDGLPNNTLSRADLNYEKGEAQNIHYGDILVKFGDYVDATTEELPYISDKKLVDKFSNSFLQDGDIIIADTAEDETVGKCTEIVGAQGKKLISGLHTIPCRPRQRYAPKFLGYYMNSNSYHAQLRPLMQGVKVISISKGVLQDTKMVLPQSVGEQGKIGAYFSNLDNLITLHQRKHDTLKAIKKYMLQNMFPKK